MTQPAKQASPIPYRPPAKLKTEFASRVSASGLTRNAYITYCIFGTVRGQHVNKQTAAYIAPKDCAQMLGQLGKIGGNVNQIAKHANAGAFMRNSIEAALSDIMEMRGVLLEFLGKKP